MPNSLGTALRMPLAARLAGTVLRPTGASLADAQQAELDRMAWRYHVTGAWVAALLNPLFILNDLAIIPEHWERFAGVRLAVSACIVFALLGRKWLGLSPRSFLLVPYLLISLENAYMWSFMGPELFRMHTLAYAVLFVGASMIAFWPLGWSLVVAVASLLANAWFLGQHSALAPADIMANGGTLLSCVVVISTLLSHNRWRLAKREVRLRLQLKASTEKERAQKELIEAAHNDLTDSIRYSQRIQQAVLPKDDVLGRQFREHFVLDRPRDIVSGDFHWCAQVGDRTIVAVADCTGHGVPGALMSILGSTLLKTIVLDQGEHRPATILDRLREELITALRGKDGLSDGMDMAICAVDHTAGELRYAGAYNPLYRVRDGVLDQVDADRMPVGLHAGNMTAFTEQVLDLRRGDMYYLCSDGLQDQFGGPDDRKFGRGRLKQLLTEVAHLQAPEQQRRVEGALQLWQQDHPSVDDILVLGFRA